MKPRLRHWLVALGLAFAFNTGGLLLLVGVNRQAAPLPPKIPDEMTSAVQWLDVRQPVERPRDLLPVAPRPASRQSAAVVPPAPQAQPPRRRAAVAVPGIAAGPLSDEIVVGDLVWDGDALGLDVALRQEALDKAPQVLRRRAIVYPAAAEIRGIEGRVRLKMRVSATGRVEQMWVLDAEPAGVFEQAAQAAARDYVFAPGVYHGQPVATLTQLELVFALQR